MPLSMGPKIVEKYYIFDIRKDHTQLAYAYVLDEH